MPSQSLKRGAPVSHIVTDHKAVTISLQHLPSRFFQQKMEGSNLAHVYVFGTLSIMIMQCGIGIFLAVRAFKLVWKFYRLASDKWTETRSDIENQQQEVDGGYVEMAPAPRTSEVDGGYLEMAPAPSTSSTPLMAVWYENVAPVTPRRAGRTKNKYRWAQKRFQRHQQIRRTAGTTTFRRSERVKTTRASSVVSRANTYETIA